MQLLPDNVSSKDVNKYAALYYHPVGFGFFTSVLGGK